MNTSAQLNILALDTSTHACTVALSYPGGTVSRYSETPRVHANIILSMIQACFDQSGLTFQDVDLLAYGGGPGSFTGLRIATAVTQSLSLAWQLPAVAISPLATIAQRAWREFGLTDVLVLIDARMAEVYCGHYQLQQSKVMQAVTPDRIVAPEAVVAKTRERWVGIGNGWLVYPQVLPEPGTENNQLFKLFPHAEDMLPLAANAAQTAAKRFTGAEIQPLYLRDDVAQKKS